ncbi:MAG: hydratase [Desulfovibrio piger]|nr:hydratase [Desulfovibrio piger]
MIQLSDKPVIVQGNTLMEQEEAAARGIDCAAARQNTLAWNILAAHNTAAGDDPTLRLRFDALASHDITYVGIIQTARASGLERFPMPYALTNCHNSLCAVGGTINEDDHLFGLTAARKYGGIFVPPHLAVIHQYAREMMAGCGKMILGSDSHTRYGALGTMAVGEGGPELVKQLLGKTYDVARPEVVLVWLENAPRPGVGPQDIAIALIGAVFKNGFVKNRVMEFAGPGVAGLSVEYRCGIDVMTTETTCLSSIWTTDDKVRDYLAMHGRADDYTELRHDKPACFDRCIRVDLSTIEPMMALPFHPSNAYPVAEVVRHADELFAAVEEEARKQFGKAGEGLKLRDKIHDGGVWVDQGIIAGCAGGSFENCCMAASILDGRSTGCGEFSLSVYPASEPQAIALVRNGAAAKLMAAGAVIKNAFCGPCFGAGDTPAHGALSIRHSTRNFPNREGSKPGNGQISAVALMDARSIAATAANGGYLTAASEVCDSDYAAPEYHFDQGVYDKRVYNGWGHPEPDYALKFGPNIKDWPEQPALTDDLLVKIVSYITDPVTTTDELIPSGETSSFRSNPLRLAEFTLSRKDPAYVPNAKAVHALDEARRAGALPEEVAKVYAELEKVGYHPDAKATNIGSAIFANKPGDGSAREQAASCQRVLGGAANFACEYATKRYRSNCINWGMLPFLLDTPNVLDNGDYVFLPGVRKALLEAADVLEAVAVKPDGGIVKFTVRLGAMTDAERQILADGCLINYYKNH